VTEPAGGPCRGAGGPDVGAGSDAHAMTFAVATLAACALPLFFTAGLALDVQRDLDMSDARLGAAITTFWIVATLASFPSGRLVDRIGAVTSVHLAGMLVAVGSLGIAVAAHSFAVFAALLAVTGVGNALIGPAMSAVVTGSLRPRRRGTVFGLQQSGPPLASVAAGLSLPTLAVALGWRWVFALGAAAALVATGVVRGERVRPPAATGLDPAARELPVRGAAPSPIFAVVVALGGLLASAAANGLIAYLVVYASASGLSRAAAGILLAAASVTCAATRIRLGARSDRRRAPLLPQMAGLVLVGAAGFALLALGTSWAAVAGSMLALGIGWGWAGLYLLSAVEHGGSAPGRSVGAAVTGTFAGATIGPLLVGLVASAASFELAWLICTALSGASAAAFLAARRLERAR
jgi:predicted MFS family arabinose efflux permease